MGIHWLICHPAIFQEIVFRSLRSESTGSIQSNMVLSKCKKNILILLYWCLIRMGIISRQQLWTISLLSWPSWICKLKLLFRMYSWYSNFLLFSYTTDWYRLSLSETKQDRIDLDWFGTEGHVDFLECRLTSFFGGVVFTIQRIYYDFLQSCSQMSVQRYQSIKGLAAAQLNSSVCFSSSTWLNISSCLQFDKLSKELINSVSRTSSMSFFFHHLSIIIWAVSCQEAKGARLLWFLSFGMLPIALDTGFSVWYVKTKSATFFHLCHGYLWKIERKDFICSKDGGKQ